MRPAARLLLPLITAITPPAARSAAPLAATPPAAIPLAATPLAAALAALLAITPQAIAQPLPQVIGPSGTVQQGMPHVIEPGPQAIGLRQPNGQFAFNAEVNGHHLTMLLDTGASLVTLRAEDAARLDIPQNRLDFSTRIATANGEAMVARISLDEITIGDITQRNVPAIVVKSGALRDNLLGMSFVGPLHSVAVKGSRVVLRQ
jgi:clan AA aspartic protease (TIGR02281 family)